MNTVSTKSPQDAPPGVDLAESSAWARLGSFAFRRRRWVLGTWVLALVAVIFAVGTIGAASDSSFESPDSIRCCSTSNALTMFLTHVVWDFSSS